MDIKNYQIQCIRCLDHDNLVTYLNNHDYTLEASILNQTLIDGREFLEITETELCQYKLNRQQVELILSCRDYISGKKSLKMNRKSSTKNMFLDANQKVSEPGGQEENIYMDMNKIVVPVVAPKPKRAKSSRQMKSLHSDESIGTFNKMVSVEDSDYIEAEQQGDNVCYQNLNAVIMIEMKAYYEKAKASESEVDAWQQTNRNQELAKQTDEDYPIQQKESWTNRRWLPPPQFSDHSADVPIITDSGTFPRPPPLVETDPNHIRLVKDLLKDYKVSQKNCPYYRNTNRQGAKDLLKRIPNPKDGLFLFRNSEEYFLVITIYHYEGFCHLGVHRNGNGSKLETKTIHPRRIQIQGFDSYINIEDFKDASDYKGTREKYRTRNIKIPEGNNKTYVCSVIAYWAVSLTLEPTVKDFKISTNDKEWGDFGDVVIQIDLKESQEELSTTFAIQFKDVSNNVKSVDSLAEGRFALAKILSQINSFKQRKDVENKKFIIYTTAFAEANIEKQLTIKTDLLHKSNDCQCKNLPNEITIVSKTVSNRKKMFVNTSDDNANIFFYFTKDNIHTLPKIYLYTHQKKQKHFGKWIDDLVSSAIYGDTKIDIHREFIKYIINWNDGILGGNYKLKKEDILVKLGHLLLYEFKVPPVIKRTEKLNYKIWQNAVQSVDVTILQKHPVIIGKVCDPINWKIEAELDLKIDTFTSSIDLDQSTIKKITNPVLKMYLFEETLSDIEDDVPIDLVYDFFWKAGLIPLLLEVKDIKEQEHVLNVISLLKSLGLIRRYLLMTSNIKTSLRYYRTLDFFVNVDDIANKLPSIVFDKVKIQITDNFSLSLKTIQESDTFFQRTIRAHEFFDMSLGRYSFKPFGNSLARKIGQDTQLVLKHETMIKLKEEIESLDEIKMVLLKYENKGDEGDIVQFLHGVKPNLFS
ncbi:unnamed protein product [Ceutorhynchus assimilis]|uniref:SH2 domain-containing protein n=1 Tax=Ceutorhynchus assimilis TaxID=467358 RepID=A0A9N9MU41_9CUCU|nr:unnamed protein product [Ceutorhynchus assimilis]